MNEKNDQPVCPECGCGPEIFVPRPEPWPKMCPDCWSKHLSYRNELARQSDNKRAQRALEAALAEGGLCGRSLSMTITSYQPPTPAARVVFERVQLYDYEHNLIILGRAGAGKTHLITGLLLKFCTQLSRTFLSATLSGLTRAYRSIAATKGETETSAFDFIASRKLLAIHDTDTRTLTDAERSLLHDLVDHRWQRRLPILLTANATPDAFSEQLGNPICSRLFEDAWPFDGLPYGVLDHEDFRLQSFTNAKQ